MSGTTHVSARFYLVIGVFLGVFTVVTVAASYLHMSPAKAIPVALLIAAVKSGLVASYFMHLKGEHRIIFAFLGLAVLFLALLMTLPAFDLVNHGTTEEGAIPPVLVEPVVTP